MAKQTGTTDYCPKILQNVYCIFNLEVHSTLNNNDYFNSWKSFYFILKLPN